MSTSTTDHRPQIGTKLKDLTAQALPYLGWRIFTCRLNEDTLGESKHSLLNSIRNRFSADDWLVEDENGGLSIGHAETNFEVSVEIEGSTLTINYTTRDGENERVDESYAVSMISECVSWRKGEMVKHKKFMRQILTQLPWGWQKVGCYQEQGRLTVVWSSNIELPFEPFPVEVISLESLPIPEESPRRVPRLFPARIHVVKQRPKRPKQRGTHSITDLMKEVDSEEGTRVPPLDRKRGVPKV